MLKAAAFAKFFSPTPRGMLRCALQGRTGATATKDDAEDDSDRPKRGASLCHAFGRRNRPGSSPATSRPQTMLWRVMRGAGCDQSFGIRSPFARGNRPSGSAAAQDQARGRTGTDAKRRNAVGPIRQRAQRCSRERAPLGPPANAPVKASLGLCGL